MQLIPSDHSFILLPHKKFPADSNASLLVFKQQHQQLTSAKHFLLLHPPRCVVAFTSH